MILTGKVLDVDGHPRGGVEIYAYHTDANGLYRPEGWSSLPPRLQGTLHTAADGTYQIDTIRPTPYPNRTIPAHIHFHLRAPGMHEQSEILWFTGDPLLKPDDYAKYGHDGTFSPIRPLLKGSTGSCAARAISVSAVQELPNETRRRSSGLSCRSVSVRCNDALLRQAGLHEPPFLDREVGRVEGRRHLPRFQRHARLRSRRIPRRRGSTSWRRRPASIRRTETRSDGDRRRLSRRRALSDARVSQHRRRPQLRHRQPDHPRHDAARPFSR